MDLSIKIDLRGPKLLIISNKAGQSGLPISSFPLTITTRGIKIGCNVFPLLQVDADTLPLFMNPSGPGSKYEILDHEDHLLYTWRFQDDGYSSQPQNPDDKSPLPKIKPSKNVSNAQMHATDTATWVGEPEPTPTPYTPVQSRKSPRLRQQEKPTLLKEERELLSFVLLKLFSKMCNYFRVLFWEPVDPEEMDLPTYRSTITRPMALGLMDLKLRDRKYSSTRSFRDDFDLIVRNSELFNGRNHPVTLMARQVEEAFVSLMDGRLQCAKLECLGRACRDCGKLPRENETVGGGKKRAAIYMPSEAPATKRNGIKRKQT